MVSLAEARAKREEVRALLAAGLDPALKRDADRRTARHSAATTFKSIAEEWLETRVGSWSEKHAQRIISILQKDTYPQISRLPMTELSNAATGKYRLLFPGVRNPGTQAMSAETINKALKSLGFEGKQTGHGFRGLASTILNERSNFHPDAIERQLAHIEDNKVRGAYNHAKHMEERHRLMRWWADYIDNAAGKKKTGKVVNLR